jgi:hypothetical protein
VVFWSPFLNNVSRFSDQAYYFIWKAGAQRYKLVIYFSLWPITGPCRVHSAQASKCFFPSQPFPLPLRWPHCSPLPIYPVIWLCLGVAVKAALTPQVLCMLEDMEPFRFLRVQDLYMVGPLPPCTHNPTQQASDLPHSCQRVKRQKGLQGEENTVLNNMCKLGHLFLQ